MTHSSEIDCIIVGYNELPFDRYVELLKHYGTDSEAYRDLKFSFVDLNGKAVNYVDLLNYVVTAAAPTGVPLARTDRFRSGEIPNLAAVYLSNFLRKRGLKTRYINLFQAEKERFAQMLRCRVGCVAITTTFYILNFPASDIVQFVRQEDPSVKIVVGGPLIANHFRNLSDNDLELALQDIGADFYVVDSQGELTLANLTQAIKRGMPPDEVPNLAFFSGRQLIRTPVVPEASSMDVVDINWEEFGREEDLGPTIQVRTARSCAFKCSFCNYPTRAGRLSLAGLETIERELNSIYQIGNVSHVVFIDDTFNVPLERFKEICRLMIRKKYGFHWFSYFRCSNSDEEAVDLMAESGCKGVFLGIESGSPEILRKMNKAATIERYADGIHLLRERSIATFGSFIVGFPGETDTTVEETVRFIRENQPDFYRAQIWYCERGTPIDRQREEYGIKGQGFVWEHQTMSSLEAIDHIDRMFLSIKESLWLPQWSFDFWFIPYALGKGLSFDNFKQFVADAGRLLSFDIAFCAVEEKQRLQNLYLKQMIESVKRWNLLGLTAGEYTSTI
jgi:radical SAM PhpK family P-methyltransferase